MLSEPANHLLLLIKCLQQASIVRLMNVRWYGQSAFSLAAEHTVFIDPFGPMDGLASRGLEFKYAPIEGASADLLLVTHEHGDHNVVEAVEGEPAVIRSLPGTHASPVGEIVGVASEHDDLAGTRRGPNTIFRFTLGGLRVAHLGDFGQPALRPEQRAAIGEVDLVFLPIGGGPTIGGEAAVQVLRDLDPRLVIPMHYRTPAVNFLDEPDAFLAAFGGRVERLETSDLETEGLLGERGDPVVAIPAPPMA
jgi:L-ascorbate metabolism protein UlaG (beta-lactamase superfamily)